MQRPNTPIFFLAVSIAISHYNPQENTVAAQHILHAVHRQKPKRCRESEFRAYKNISSARVLLVMPWTSAREQFSPYANAFAGEVYSVLSRLK